MSLIQEILQIIKNIDPLHYRRVSKSVDDCQISNDSLFRELEFIVENYYREVGMSAEYLVTDYLKLVKDYRNGGLYFNKNGFYPCKNQYEANLNVYSKPEIMSYYMSALLISQLLWQHHFKMFEKFNELLFDIKTPESRILEIGPGHGLFSYFIQKNFDKIYSHDIIDISSTSLELSNKIMSSVIDTSCIKFIHKDVFKYESKYKYDFIVMGEVLEHLDEPLLILERIYGMLSNEGVLWITTPTNSPAIDHVYWFKSRSDVLNLIKQAGFDIINSYSFLADDVTEEFADKNKLTNLVGVIAKKNKKIWKKLILK